MLNLERFEAEAHNLGFSFLNILPVPQELEMERYRRWISAGHSAGMAYLSNARGMSARAQPELLLPGLRSIVVLAYPYQPSAQSLVPAAGFGQVAAYALYPDYHDFLLEKCTRLAKWMEDAHGRPLKWKVCIDSSPLLERALGVRAGFGWIGRNTSLISARIGSFFWLAEILTDLPWEASPPLQTDRCGTCRRCVDACPTGCLLPDRSMDAGRCLSYLTIENRAPIPPHLRPLLGDRVFGCDICQQVCPWNRSCAVTGKAHADPAPVLPAQVDLLAELQHTPETFKARYRGLPIWRAKYEGWMRNLLIAAGNQRLPGAEPIALRLLEQSGSSVVRGQAAWTLGVLDSPECRKHLSGVLQHETDPAVREEIRQALT